MTATPDRAARPARVAALAILAAIAGLLPGSPRAADGDHRYGQAELAAMLSGHAVEFFDGSVARYRADGAYSYKYSEADRPWLGQWQVRGPGRVCVTFATGRERCDDFVSDGTRMVLITDGGMRFPVRQRRPLVDGY